MLAGLRHALPDRVEGRFATCPYRFNPATRRAQIAGKVIHPGHGSSPDQENPFAEPGDFGGGIAAAAPGKDRSGGGCQ
ncbi:hypothetical protein GCM10011358_27400 [Sinisalibacter lacisalsi]|uniref:Uncharacterized protein n=1 Tax=Sinisalibacter lacisalsi TaxID=1526570 RepID=A0ABQ1QTE7_9RHOB|nr:hypothetical protein GCM10011358_27400 [Sinisalibacter lacisalsi]